MPGELLINHKAGAVQMARAKRPAVPREAESYQHPHTTSPMRPDVGTQAQFKKRKPPQKYRYDDSLSPALEWDGQNSAREKGEQQLAVISEQLSEIRKIVAQGSPSSPAAIPALERGKDMEKPQDRNSPAAIQDPDKVKDLEKPQDRTAGPALQRLVSKADEAVQKLKALSKPFLNWAGKAERLSFDVPTLPLFVHERLSTKAIIETLTGHKRSKQLDMYSLFGDPQHSVTDQVLRAYEHRDQWVNRMMLGDSLAVMNSLLHYEGLGGQVQMIYMDPPYGVKFGSNFQPFVRKRDVSHNDDEDMTREPEMVQAYRDTWELGLHSYLTYLRDRLLLARDLLAPSGSVFIQIGDENVHRVRDVLDEVFQTENFVAAIAFQKTGGQNPVHVAAIYDTLLWYAKDKALLKTNPLYISHPDPDPTDPNYVHLELLEGSIRAMTPEERRRQNALPEGAKVFRYGPITSAGASSTEQVFKYDGEAFRPPGNSHWKTTIEGLQVLASHNRILRSGRGLAYKLYWHDFAAERLPNLWTDTQSGGFNDPQVYVVQTTTKVVARCILMTTAPGDLVIDPTCGSGTTAYVAEQWGRRWITMDTSRVPLALARQRLLTATFPWYELNDNARGPAGGFVYQRKQNNKGEEVGGIVPHVTLESIANNEPPKEEVLVDRPERDNKITRVTGAFCVEGTIPTPVDLDDSVAVVSSPPSAREDTGATTFTDRMLEILRKSPVLRLAGNKTLALKNIRPPAKTLSLSAEAMVDATAPGQTPSITDAVQEAAEKSGNVLPLSAKSVALAFGPENGAVSESLVFNAAKEAWAKSYSHLYVIGFAIQPNARELIEKCNQVVGIASTYIQATPDLLMGDLLKNMRSSQIFSVCGLPEIKIHVVAPVSPRATAGEDTGATKGAGEAASAEPGAPSGATTFQVELLGLDVFDPVTMEVDHPKGDDVPAWFLDTDYNGLCFHVSQAFFPRTSAWDNLKKALKGEYEESVWDHLSGTKSAPFEAGEHKQIAVKVIDDRGNELMVVEKLS
jgi:adenine-specific DNA-methyltransferase